MEKIHQELDDLLVEIGSLGRMKKNLTDMAEKEIARIREDFGPGIDDLATKIKSREKTLIILAKRHKNILFCLLEAEAQPVEVRIDLEHGALIYSVEKKVKQIKGMLYKLKLKGFKNGIKRSESVDWDMIEKWSDSTLAELGTARQKKERFAYEIHKTAGEKDRQ